MAPMTTRRPPNHGRRPLVIAHRGGAPLDIENSLAAFEHGIEVGSDLIECDLRTSADGVVVLYHDATIDAVPVRSLDVATLRARVPTLLTLPEFVAWANLQTPAPRVVFDLKERDIDRRIVSVLADPVFRARVIVTTQHTASIRRLRARFPDLRVGLSRGQAAAGAHPPALRPWIVRLLRPVVFWWLLPQLRWSRADTVVIHYRLATPPTVGRFRRAGYRIYAWTVDDCLDAQRLMRAGVDFIATNAPWLLRGCLGLFEADQSNSSG